MLVLDKTCHRNFLELSIVDIANCLLIEILSFHHTELIFRQSTFTKY
jgi:hypothetical protein